MEKNRTQDPSENIVHVGEAGSENSLYNQPESRYECPICLNWLNEPVLTTCGHRFCKLCITSWLKNSGHCPIDSANLTEATDIFPDNYTRREIMEQRMTCPFAPKGCQVKVGPLDLEEHIATCAYNKSDENVQTNTLILCSFSNLGCKVQVKSQEELAAHLQDAIHNHLSFLMNAYSEVKIQNDIFSASSNDSKAQEAMSLWEPDKNRSSGEPGTNTSSTSIGAPSSGTKRGTDNTNALIRALYERVVVLEQRNREQDIIVGNMSRQVAALTIGMRKRNEEMVLRYCMGTYIWNIDNFQTRLEAMQVNTARMLYSPGFYTSPNGYRFCVRLNISPQNPSCLALHIHLMKSEFDDCLDWPFNGRISLTMLNTSNPELTQRDTMMSRSNLVAFQRPTCDICPRGFGFTEYALIQDVCYNGFVTSDVLKLKIIIKLV